MAGAGDVIVHPATDERPPHRPGRPPGATPAAARRRAGVGGAATAPARRGSAPP